MNSLARSDVTNQTGTPDRLSSSAQAPQVEAGLVQIEDLFVVCESGVELDNVVVPLLLVGWSVAADDVTVQLF